MSKRLPWKIRKCGACKWRLTNGTGTLCEHCKNRISGTNVKTRKKYKMEITPKSKGK